MKKIKLYLSFVVTKLYNKWFNKLVKEQEKDYKKIPIVIISFNQLKNLKRLVNYLTSRGYKNIIIIDNNSNYPPLLNFFESIQSEIKVYRLKKNYGHRVFWLRLDLFKKYTYGYYAITDPDIMPINECPYDFLDYFKKVLDRYRQVDKVGFSLKIDDIPDTQPNKRLIISWETKYWLKPTKEGDFFAEIDTTFALYRPGHAFVSYKGIRANSPYMARHLGWYTDPLNLSEEEDIYYNTSNSSSTWKTDNNGSLLHNYYDKIK